MPRPALIAAIYGALAGALAAVTLWCMNGVRHWVWSLSDARWYIPVAIMVGGVLIALIRHLSEDADLNAQLAQGRLAGRHIVWVPEFRTRKGDTQLRRWRCGSADIDPAWLPATCKDDVRLLQAPGS